VCEWVFVFVCKKHTKFLINFRTPSELNFEPLPSPTFAIKKCLSQGRRPISGKGGGGRFHTQTGMISLWQIFWKQTWGWGYSWLLEMLFGACQRPTSRKLWPALWMLAFHWKPKRSKRAAFNGLIKWGLTNPGRGTNEKCKGYRKGVVLRWFLRVFHIIIKTYIQF